MGAADAPGVRWKGGALRLERFIDDREPLVALLEHHIGDPEQASQLFVGDLHRRGGGSGPWVGLPNASDRARGEGELASNFWLPLVVCPVGTLHFPKPFRVS